MTVALWVLAVLLILLVILVALLFVPMSYRVEASSEGGKQAHVSAGWLGKVFQLQVDWYAGAPLVKELYIAFMCKMNTRGEYEAWLLKKQEEEERCRLEAGIEEPVAPKEPLKVRLSKGIDQAKEKVEEVKAKVEDMKTKVEDYKEKRRLAKEKALAAKNNPETVEKPKKKLPLKEAIKEKLWFVPYVTKVEFYQEIAYFLKRVALHSKPNYFHTRGVFGTGDPAYTAMIAGAFFSYWPHIFDEVRFNYLDKAMEGTFEFSGKIRPAYMIWYALAFAFSAPIKPIWMHIVKKKLKGE